MAENADPLRSVFRRHRCQPNLKVHHLNNIALHVGIQNGSFAERTGVLARLGKGAQARGMHTVSTGQELNGGPRGVERFETDGAIDMSRIRHTFVRVEGRCLDTDPALVAMSVFDGTSHTADATIITVKLSLVFVVKKDAHGAPVGAEGRSTARTGLGCQLLRVA